jgi:hypothetical protein
MPDLYTVHFEMTTPLQHLLQTLCMSWNAFQITFIHHQHGAATYTEASADHFKYFLIPPILSVVLTLSVRQFDITGNPQFYYQYCQWLLPDSCPAIKCILISLYKQIFPLYRMKWLLSLYLRRHQHSCPGTSIQTKKQKQTPWPLVRERTIPTDRPPLVDEI